MVFPHEEPPENLELTHIGAALEWDDPSRPGVAFHHIAPAGFECPSPWEELYIRWAASICNASVSNELATPNVAHPTAQQLTIGDGWRSPADVPAEMTVRRCDTRRGEAIAAARRIREWLDERQLLGTDKAATATDGILVLLPWTRSRLDLWRRVFENYDLPFRPGNTDKLFEKPIARWVCCVAEIVQWKDRAVSRATLREVIDGPFWSAASFARKDGCESRGLRRRFGKLLRSFRSEFVDYDRWIRHLKISREIARDKEYDTASYDAVLSLSKALHEAARDDEAPIRDISHVLGIQAEGTGIFDVWSRLNATKGEPFVHAEEAKVAFGTIARLLERLHYDRVETDRSRLANLLRARFRETMLEPGDEYEHGPVIMPYELYDGRSAELLFCAGLGEGEFPRPAPHFTATDRAWIEALDLGDPDEFSRSHVERDVTRLVVAMDRCLTGGGEVQLSWALEGSGTEVVYPGAALSLLIGGWDESDWHEAPENVETVRAADEIPRRLDEAVSANEVRLFAHDANVLSWLETQDDDGVEWQRELRAEWERLGASRLALRERAPSTTEAAKFGAHTGMLPGRVAQAGGYSASALENFGKCPSQYFFRRVLSITDDGDAGEFPDHLEIGNVVHDALFRAATAAIALADDNLWRMAGPEGNAAETRRAIHVSLDVELERVLDRTTLSRALVERIAARWRTSVDTWLDSHLGASFPRVVALAEFSMNADYGGSDPRSVSEPVSVDMDDTKFAVRGKIDRVDFDPATGRIAIRDYKSGSGKYSWWLRQQIAKGVHVQLPLYAMAVEALVAAGELRHLVTDGNPVAVSEVSLEFVLDPGYAAVQLDESVAKLRDASGAEPTWRDISRRWIASHVQNIKFGRFPLRPTECPLEETGYCDFERVCGYTPGRELEDVRVDVPVLEEVESENSTSSTKRCRTLASPPTLAASFDLDEARRQHAAATRASCDVSTDVAISAGAGTGKTYNLVLRYLSALAPDPAMGVNPADPGEILCVTFTRRAAGEMKKRIRSALLGEPDERQKPFVDRVRRDPERLRRILLELSNAPVMTIDAAASTILAEAMALRDEPMEFDVVAASDVTAELQAFCSRAFTRDLDPDLDLDVHLQTLADEYPPSLLRNQLAALMTTGIPPGLKELSTVEERANAILADWRQAAHLALADFIRGARVVWDVDKLEEIAGSEQEGDKYSDGFRQNDELIAFVRRVESEDPADWSEERLLEAYEFLNSLSITQKAMGKDTPLYDYMKPRKSDLDMRIRFQPERHDAIKAWFECDDAEELATFAARATFVADRWDEKFRAHLRRRGKLRYGDVEHDAIHALTDEKTRAELAVRFPFRHIFVDEVQDTNESQHRLIDELASAASEATGEPCRRFFVGDLKQSIYRFRGAEVDVFADRLTRYPRHSLALNFRSTPRLLRAFNALFSDILPAPTDPRAQIPYEPLAPGLDPHEQPQVGAPIELIAAADDSWGDDALAEASSVFDDAGTDDDSPVEVTPVTRQVEAATVRRIAELVEQADTSGPEPVVALLVHAWNRAHYYQDLLASHGVRAAVQGGSGLLSTREVSNLTTWLEAVCLPERRTAQLGCLRSAGFAISDVALYCLSQGFGVPETDRRHRALEAARRLNFDPAQAITDWVEADPELDVDAASRQLEHDAANLKRFRAEWRRLGTEFHARPASEVFAEFLDRHGLRGFWHGQDHGRQRVANLERFLDLVRDFEQSHGVSPLALVRHLDMLREGDDPAAGGLEASGGAPVVLTTYWQAKGLEWPIVVLPDIQRTTTGNASHGLAPERVVISEGGFEQVAYLMTPKRPLEGKAKGHAKSDISDVASQFVGPALRAELRRQLYVAMTRAKQKVLVSGVFSLPERALVRQDTVGAGLCETKTWADALRMGLDIRFDDGSPYFGTVGDTPDRTELLDGCVSIGSPQQFEEASPSVRNPGSLQLPGSNPTPDRWASALCPVIERRNPSDEKPHGELPEPDPALTVLPETLEHHTTPFSHETVEGTAFHRLMELLAFSEDPPIDDAIDSIFEELLIAEVEDDPRRARLHTLWQRAMGQKELVHELRDAADRGELYHEVPFRYQDDEEGVWYDGLIDLVWEDDLGHVHVIDYKTGDHPTVDDPANEILRKHHAQVAIYGFALGHCADEPVASCGLWYVSGGAIVRWSLMGRTEGNSTHVGANERNGVIRSDGLTLHNQSDVEDSHDERRAAASLDATDAIRTKPGSPPENETGRSTEMTTHETRAPWISSTTELEEILQAEGEGEGVLLTHPGQGHSGVGLGKALNHALLGETRSISVLAGFFGHNLVRDRRQLDSEGLNFAALDEWGDDPASIIIREGREGYDAPAGPETVGFRALISACCSPAASMAVRAWYWLTRWKYHSTGAAVWRKKFVAETVKKGFARVASVLLLDGQKDNSIFSFDAVDWDDERAMEAFSLDTEPDPAEALREWRRWCAEVRSWRESNPGALEAASLLFGFFVQRRADFRIRPLFDTTPKKGVLVRRFHPKIYVVERASDTITFSGSNNWSSVAFGLTPTPGNTATMSNVEVATVHVTHGHHWRGDRLEPIASLGTKIAATAFNLFEEAPLLGAWEQSEAPIPVARAMEITRCQVPDNIANRLQELLDTEDGDTEGPTNEPTEKFLALVPYLRALVRQMIGLDLDRAYSDYVKRFRLHEQFSDKVPLFGGKIPSSYQLDGALRLLGILEGSEVLGLDRSRGAFLTDEAGLGKTLVAQVVASIQIAARLAARPLDAAQLKASLIVPARLTGQPKKTGAPATGWYQHAEEIRRAVRALLEDVHGCENAEERLTVLDLNVFSHGGFSPRNLPDTDDRNDVWEACFGHADHPYLHDFQHIAESEVVVIDESHNFRNQNSRATRTLRMLLSLPVPGEDWPVIAPGGTQTPEGERLVHTAADDLGHQPVRRSVLCLSATPFNNRIDDLITQIGHFAQAQNWHLPYQGKFDQLGFDDGDPKQMLGDALSQWCETSNDVARESAFATIVQFARRHLYSGRSLSIREDRRQEIREDNKKLRNYYDDLGPEYQWAQGAKRYTQAFAKALRWLYESEDESEADAERQEQRQFEARQELDAVLTELFVQRSRIRALRIIEASSHAADEGAEDVRGDEQSVDEMFRNPRVPRHPLPLELQRSQDDLEASGQEQFEARVLGDLYRLMLGESEGDVQEPSLALFAYELSARRGRRGAQAQTVRNAKGFQVVGLIKRLQSSPYAFFRTLLRGAFRRSLSELALVERLFEEHYERLDLWLEGRDVTAAQVEDGLTILIPHIEDKLGVVSQYLPRLLGGRWERRHEHFLGLLSGSYAPEGFKLEERQHQATYQEAYESLVAELQNDSPDDGTKSWALYLLEDVSRSGDSRLWKDIRQVIDWIDSDSTGLFDELYPELKRLGTDLRGRPYHEIAAYAATLEPGHKRLRYFIRWLNHRLKGDRRPLALLAWALIQAAARLDGRPPTELLPGGDRTLVFTEYTDTQEYVLTLYTAVVSIFRAAESGTEYDGLRRLLVDGVRNVAEALHRAAVAVTDGESEEYAFTDRQLYLSPISDGLDGWLGDWLARVEGGEWELLDEAVANFGQQFARVSSDYSEFLSDFAGSDFHPTDEQDGEPVKESDTHVIDALSPWYQVEPDDHCLLSECRNHLERLTAAAEKRVSMLLTTDVLAEGVNLQECGVIAHYDLPWNPTVLIQRNGRIDRRLNPAYEEPGNREQLFTNLCEKAAVDGAWRRPAFGQPKQVYHLTVVPVEPKNPDADNREEQDRFENRVRRYLFRKLEEIRALFGLSNWPAVLGSGDVEQVLTGELDYETPGFRRREDLFAAWRELERLAAAGRNSGLSVQDATNSLVVTVGSSFTERLHRTVCGHQNPPGEARLTWGSLRLASVTTATRFLPESLPVRSPADLARAITEGKGAFTGGLIFNDRDPAAIGWAEMGHRDRRLMCFRATLADPPEAAGFVNLELDYIDLSTLQTATSWTELNPLAPTAPTELAQDILVTLVKMGIDGARLDFHDSDRLFDVRRLRLPSSPFVRWLERTPILNQVQRSDKPAQFALQKVKPELGAWSAASGPLGPEQPLDEELPTFNLWLRIDP